MWLPSNSVIVNKDDLKPGDHICTWRNYIYAHHGIYVGDNKVIHFTNQQGSGTALSSVASSSGVPCSTCTIRKATRGVVLQCLQHFLDINNLFRFEYGVTVDYFLAQIRGGTCTLAVSDPDDIVVHRANYLLNNGFGSYNVFKNNCEDFAIYCKTGLIGLSGQVVTAVAAVSSLTISSGPGAYNSIRLAADIGMRKDVRKVPVEVLTRWLAAG